MSDYDPEELFAALCARYGEPDNRGEVKMTCPFCGAPVPAGRGDYHFSFSANGGKCFKCGEGAGIVTLARMLGVLEDGREYTPPPRVYQKPKLQPAPVYHEWNKLARVYVTHPQRVELWQAYKPLPEELIRAYQLGVGAWPRFTSQCRHNRLQVPMIAEGRVQSFRGRRIDCDCPKWLSPKGFAPILYNGERLGYGPGLGMAWGDRRVKGGVLFIVENAIDALLLERADARLCAVATLSVTYWEDSWTEALRQAAPYAVFVCFDNDRPGNGAGNRGRQAWMEKHERDMVPNGIKLVNRLLKARIPARLFDWKDLPLKTDVGDLIVATEMTA